MLFYCSILVFFTILKNLILNFFPSVPPLLVFLFLSRLPSRLAALAVSLRFSQRPQGEKDWEKYEVARKLKLLVDDIRHQYNCDLKSKQMNTRQRAVALYFIDKVCLMIKMND